MTKNQKNKLAKDARKIRMKWANRQCEIIKEQYTAWEENKKAKHRDPPRCDDTDQERLDFANSDRKCGELWDKVAMQEDWGGSMSDREDWDS